MESLYRKYRPLTFDSVVGCGLLLERDLDLVGCFGGNEVALCVCHALWTPIAAGSPYGLL